MQWWEIYVQIPESMSDAVSDCLHRLGSTAVVIHDTAALTLHSLPCVSSTPQHRGWTVLQGAFPADQDLAAHVVSLQTFLQQQAANDVVSPLRLYCRQLLDTAYLTQWQQFFKPLWIGSGLCIRPPWDTAPLPPYIACLTLEPGLAFGTGSHPTTHLCLKMLSQWIPREQSETLLDVGCGSGILSLAALKLGVPTAIGVDIDPQAVTVAQHNATVNGLQHRVQFLHGSWDLTRKRFDLITANIYLEPLVNMTLPLTQRLRRHGTLILSGILISQEAMLRAALSRARLVVHERLSEAEWVALAVRHSDSGVK
jgi:ribosomal protein L11 methyltransferase